MISIKRFNKFEMLDFVNSAEYDLLPVIPISKARAESYIHNPNCTAQDTVLYIAYFHNEIVGFRTIFADKINTDIEKKKIGWLSGNWVSENHRRKGISSKLFATVFKDWQGQLLYTNYAPASKAVYDKTTSFYNYAQLEGYRYYFRSSLDILLSKRKAYFKYFRPIFKIVDYCTNKIIDSKQFKTPDSTFIKYITIDEEVCRFLESKLNKGLSSRTATDFKYIFDYPWIYQLNTPIKQHYPFSSGFEHYKKISIGSYNEFGINGFAHIHIKNGIASVPFYVCNNESVSEFISNIHYIFKKEKVEYFTTYNTQLILDIEKNKFSCIGKKRMTRSFFASKDIKNELKPSYQLEFQDGEGDVAFL